MATRAQRNRLAIQPLPELPKRRNETRDRMVDYALVALALVVGGVYYFFS